MRQPVIGGRYVGIRSCFQLDEELHYLRYVCIIIIDLLTPPDFVNCMVGLPPFISLP